ncbi:hypothetical protein PVAP13_4NG270700 [Panicum virgatum]|nr:hypothetical protein PVAP13_4NG270700 [Panicum virgatum]KAG2607747.1 hypothetical protein PVAP13_4NG270700 [Panicum virgatum]
MHELLAPLLYVLHADVQHFKQVRDLHEELLDDDFDGQTFPDRSKLNRSDRKNNVEGRTSKIRSLADLDPDTRDLFLINDAYGAEGELGIILSEKFMEHDVYSMFENLMNGAQGVVAITDFYSLSPAPESSTGLTPVREASSAIYHLLASVDSSLHSHLVELGVEPQYFALRWLRVLFGREFSLDNLLFIWDEIFSSPNHSYSTDISMTDYHFKVLSSPRGALILSMAVSMMLHLRSSLLGSEHATSCLVRLLNFPEDIDLKTLIEKATLLQSLALEANLPSSSVRGKSLLSTPNYWEETWKILQSSIDQKGGGVFKMKGRGFLRRSLSNTNTESNVSRSKAANSEKNNFTSTRQPTIDELHNTDVVPANLINSVPQMPIEEQKDHIGQSTSEAIGSNSKNSHETGQRDGYCSTSGEIKDSLGAASGYLSRTSSTSLSCGTEYDHDTHHMEEPCVPCDDNVVNEPDPHSGHRDRTDEATATMNRTSGVVETHPVQQERLCSVDGKLKIKYDQNPTMAEGGQKETLVIGSISNTADKELTRTLRYLGESMVENIQVTSLTKAKICILLT